MTPPPPNRFGNPLQPPSNGGFQRPKKKPPVYLLFFPEETFTDVAGWVGQPQPAYCTVPRTIDTAYSGCPPPPSNSICIFFNWALLL